MWRHRALVSPDPSPELHGMRSAPPMETHLAGVKQCSLRHETLFCLGWERVSTAVGHGQSTARSRSAERYGSLHIPARVVGMSAEDRGDGTPASHTSPQESDREFKNSTGNIAGDSRRLAGPWCAAWNVRRSPALTMLAFALIHTTPALLPGRRHRRYHQVRRLNCSRSLKLTCGICRNNAATVAGQSGA